MKPEWFIIIENHQEGPFSLLDLKRDPRFTPDTLVWKRGFTEWVAARFIAELQQIFKDEPEGEPLHEGTKKITLSPLGQDQATLTMRQDPFQFLLWILLFFLILIYTLYQFYN